ncbi:bacteriorhodopsin [Spiribacter onubensis]|uniref:Bacteriorhodopsin n=1 Tax=Spiribacter onubensis TaxID=3122420 RepID=A0ABV3SAK4_9GAMM
MMVFESADLTAASFSAALFGLVATSILLLLGTAWVGQRWKVTVTLCACAAVVGAGAMFEGREAWTTGSVPILYHYAGWIISMPLQVLALYFFANAAGRQRIGLFWRLVVAAVLMVFVRYLGEAQLMHAALAFLIGLAFWLYILGELFFGRMDTAVRESDHDAIRRGYFWLRLIVMVGWAIYPLGNFIMSFGSFIDGGGISVTYNVADFLNRMTFGVAVLATAIMATRHSQAQAAGDNEEQRS